jgi:hypothetical protein
MKRTIIALALGAALAVPALADPAGAARPAKPDTACQQAGLNALRDLGALPSVAKSGVDAGTLAGLGVRGVEDVPDSTIFRLPQVLSLHRSSPELFPWCDAS